MGARVFPSPKQVIITSGLHPLVRLFVPPVWGAVSQKWLFLDGPIDPITRLNSEGQSQNVVQV